MIKSYIKLVFSIALIGCLATSCKDKDPDTSTVEQPDELINPESRNQEAVDNNKTVENNELPVVSSVQSEDAEDSSYNPDKVNSGIKAFSLEEVLNHSNMNAIKLGMSMEELKDYNLKANQIIENINRTDQYGNRRTHRIVTGGVPVVELSMNGDTVNAITFLSRNAFPKDMIGVDYSYKVLSTKYPNLIVNGDQVTTTNDGKKLIFLMETVSSDGKTMPDSAQIVEMTVMNQVES